MKSFLRGVCAAMALGLLAAPLGAGAPFVLAVMDPLAAPLSCPCVEGYAQRDYRVLGSWLQKRLGREVRVGFGESLKTALEDIGANGADLVIGKDSVVRADGAAVGVTPIAQLTGRRGKTTQTGLLVVAAGDPAQAAADLKGYEFYFGPKECDEKHNAAVTLLKSAGITPEVSHVSAACSDGAATIVQRFADDPETRAVAVISSYAAPLLEGCGTINEGDLRVVGETEPVPFVTAFVTDRLDGDQRETVATALLDIVADPAVMQSLETLRGFTPIDAGYGANDGANDQATPATAPVDSTDKTSEPGDNASWPGFRGPNRDNVAAWLPEKLAAEPAFVWRQELSRPGLGGVAVADGRVVIGDRDFTNEFDVWRCYDAETGEEVWDKRYPAPGSLDYDNAPRATPLLAGGRAYLLGAFGHLSCVRLEDGRKIWRKRLRREYGDSGRLTWGACCSPLLVDGVLIVCPAAADAVWLGLDPETGDELWRAEGDHHAFASPVVVTRGGVRQFVGYDRSTLGGWRIDTGERLWSHRPPVEGDFNVPTPALVGERLFVVTENNGARLFDLDKTGRPAETPVGKVHDLVPDTSSPTVFEGRVYCLWEGLRCLTVSDSGRLDVAWTGEDDSLPETGHVLAGPTAAGSGRLLVVGGGGELLLLDTDASSTQLRVVSRQNVFGVEPGEGEDLLCQPALVGSRLYLRSDDELVCLELAEAAGV